MSTITTNAERFATAAAFAAAGLGLCVWVWRSGDRATRSQGRQSTVRPTRSYEQYIREAKDALADACTVKLGRPLTPAEQTYVEGLRSGMMLECVDRTVAAAATPERVEAVLRGET